jgi:hypothetical protein
MKSVQSEMSLKNLANYGNRCGKGDSVTTERTKNGSTTLDSIFFVTPEQRLMRFLLNECSTSFTSRVLSSKLKGVRGLGGAEGIKKILDKLAEIGLIQYIDNNRAIILRNDHVATRILKGFGAACDLEGLSQLLEPLSSKGILFGSRTTGMSRSDSNYDLLVVTHSIGEVQSIVEKHPLNKKVDLITLTPESFLRLDADKPALAKDVHKGIILWGSVF